jgi:hypothetical protein
VQKEKCIKAQNNLVSSGFGGDEAHLSEENAGNPRASERRDPGERRYRRIVEEHTVLDCRDAVKLEVDSMFRGKG